MIDKEIINGILNENEDSLEELKNNYGKLIYGVINKILNTSVQVSEIDECFNDVLLCIWNNIDCYDEAKGKLCNFLISISKYRALDYKRKIQKNNKLIQLDENIIGNLIEVDNIQTQINEESFYELIKVLKDKDKVIFVRRYLLDETIEKISLDLGLTKEALYKRLSRGKEKIKKIIKLREVDEK